MMKKSKVLGSMGLFVAILLNGAMLMPSFGAAAETRVVFIEGARYDVTCSLRDNLKSLVGKKVYVTLNSGKTFAGFIKEVGDHLLHLEKLDGKDYFDALIRVEDIGAIDTRFRDVQR